MANIGGTLKIAVPLGTAKPKGIIVKVNNAYCYIDIELNQWSLKKKKKGSVRGLLAGGKFTTTLTRSNDGLHKALCLQSSVIF